LKEKTNIAQRYCCTSAIFAAIHIRVSSKTLILSFYRGIRLMGNREVLYAESLKKGTYTFNLTKISPVVNQVNDKTLVR